MQRAMNVVVALFGMLLLVALVIVGADIYRAAQRGPKWKRRLIAAALVLLGALGLATAQKAQAQSPPPRPAAGAGAPMASPASQPAQELTKTPQWLAIVDAWHFAGPLATSGKSTVAQRKEVDQKITRAEAAVRLLLKSGAIEAFEADLLLDEAQRIKKQVYRGPPTDLMVECYKPVWVRPTMDSLARLQMRMPRLEAMLRTGRVRPEVLGKVLPAIEADLEMLGNAQQTEKDHLTEVQRTKAREVRARVATSLKEIRAKLPPQPATLAPATRPGTVSAPADKDELTKTKEWLAIVDAWHFVGPLADSGKSTMVQRKQVDEKVAAATKAVKELGNSGRIDQAESELLVVEIQRLRTAVYKNPPADGQVKCYDTMEVVPARQSLSRLQRRAASLTSLAGSGKVHPEVLYKVLPSIIVDMAVLGDQKELDKLSKEDQAKADEVRASLAANLKEIQAKLPAPAGGLTPATRPAPATTSAPAEKDALTTSKEWLTIVDAWYVAGPLAASKDSTTAQRNEAMAKLDLARKNAQVLAGRTLLGQDEAKLLAQEIEKMQADITSRPLVDLRAPCYGPTRTVMPGKDGLDRLRTRLPILKKFLQGTKVHPAVLAKVLPTVEADIVLLGQEDKTKDLNKDERAEADKVRVEAQVTLTKVRQLANQKKETP